MKRFPEAIAAYERALALDDSHHITWGNLARLCARLEHYKHKSEAAFRNGIAQARVWLIEHSSDVEARSRLASYLASVGDSAEAVKEGRIAAAMGKENPNVQVNIAGIWGEYDLIGEGAECLARAIRLGYRWQDLATLPIYMPLLQHPTVQAAIDDVEQSPDTS
jgi:hypothetical protein